MYEHADIIAAIDSDDYEAVVSALHTHMQTASRLLTSPRDDPRKDLARRRRTGDGGPGRRAGGNCSLTVPSAVWRLLRLFDEEGVQATFFAAAVALERNPGVGGWIQRAGHDVCSHGWRWSEHWLLDREEERERIAATVASITRTCGAPPAGWYCRYSASVSTRELVAEYGGPLVYDSDAYNDDLPYYTEVSGRRQLVVPYNSLPYNDARYVAGMTPADYVDMCCRGLDQYRREGLAGYPKMMSVGLHPRWSGQASRATAVRDIIEYAKSLGDVWIARRIDIARCWEEHHESFGSSAGAPESEQVLT